MALTAYAVDVRPPRIDERELALVDATRSLQRTGRTLSSTRPLTGRADTDAAVATTLAAFSAALIRITGKGAPPTGTVDVRPGESRAVTPAEAVAGGIAALQRLGMRARLYADEIWPFHVELDRLRALAASLREFGAQCDTLSFDLQPARAQMEEALSGLDALGIGRAALSQLTRSGDDLGTFLAAPPGRQAALTAHIQRATEAYAQAEAARDRLGEGLTLVRDEVSAL